MLNDVRHPEAPPFSFVLRAVPLLNNIQPGCYNGATVTKEFSRTSPPLTPSLSSPDRDSAVQKCLCRPIWWPALGGHTGQGEQGKGSTSRGHWQQLTSLLPGSNQPIRPLHNVAERETEQIHLEFSLSRRKLVSSQHFFSLIIARVCI